MQSGNAISKIRYIRGVSLGSTRPKDIPQTYLKHTLARAPNVFPRPVTRRKPECQAWS